MRHVDVIYRPEGPGWAASSPDVPEYVAYGDSLAEVLKLAHEGLAFHFDVDAAEVSISDFVETPPGIVLANSGTAASSLGAAVSTAVAVAGVNVGEVVVRSTSPQSVRNAEVQIEAVSAA